MGVSLEWKTPRHLETAVQGEWSNADIFALFRVAVRVHLTHDSLKIRLKEGISMGRCTAADSAATGEQHLCSVQCQD